MEVCKVLFAQETFGIFSFWMNQTNEDNCQSKVKLL